MAAVTISDAGAPGASRPRSDNAPGQGRVIGRLGEQDSSNSAGDAAAGLVATVTAKSARLTDIEHRLDRRDWRAGEC